MNQLTFTWDEERAGDSAAAESKAQLILPRQRWRAEATQAQSAAA